MASHALLIGNSDGIGLALTRRLLGRGYRVTGISKSAAPIDHPEYQHFVQDVTGPAYRALLQTILAGQSGLDLCVYCAGIGGPLDFANLAFQTRVFEVNLMAAVVTTELVLDHMIKNGSGHFIGLSSIADGLTSAEIPSYSASKAGISRYWEGLGLALPGKSVKVTNVRFGFVDTKMAKARSKPLMLTAENAARFIEAQVNRPRIRATKPYAMGALVWLLERYIRLSLLVR
jgi:NAD(P)-dependent dehydrogenase (short-subunit alcohol dehydrogenase family)